MLLALFATRRMKLLTHIFLHCPNITTNWERLGLKQFINSINPLVTPTQWLKPLVNGKFRQMSFKLNPQTLLPICLWNIWKIRNTNIFDKKHIHVPTTHILHQAIEYKYLTSNYHSKPPLQPL